jgi:hypothetical protein
MSKEQMIDQLHQYWLRIQETTNKSMDITSAIQLYSQWSYLGVYTEWYDKCVLGN